MIWIPIILASIIPFIVATIFYHPKLFGHSKWSALIYSSDKINWSSTLALWAVSLLTCIMLSFFFTEFNNGGINQEGDFDNFAHGAWHGAFIAVTIVIPITVTNGILSKTAWKSVLINILFWLISLAIMGGILDAMIHWDNLILPVE